MAELWLSATLKSYGVEHPVDIPLEHINFMRSLPLLYRTPTHILVHAGLNFCLDDPFSREGEQAMLWDRYQRSDLEKQSGRTLVVGYTIRHEDEIRDSLVRHYRARQWLLPGASFDGRGCLTALEMVSGHLYLQGNCEGSY